MPRQSGATSVLAMPRLPHTRDPPSAPKSSPGAPTDAVGYAGAWLTPPHPSCISSLPRAHTAGFANLGNTCFLNAALQCLLHTPLTTLLLSAATHDNFTPQTNRFCVFCALQALARQLHTTPSPRVIAPSAFADNARLVCAAFRHGRQEDAHEFVRALLDGMTRAQVFGCAFGRAGGAAVAWHREMNADVHRLFGGVLQSCVHCMECGFKSITTEPFLDLSLEITRVSTVERALDRFCAVETLQGDNRYKCEGCRSLVNAQKRFSVRRAPNVLTLHLKRFDRTRKDARFIAFPNVLDLAPYMYGRPSEATALYKLSAILIHQGTSRQFGHYFAYVRNANGNWSLKDDSTSRTVDLSTVMRQKAYLLFYTRIDDTTWQKGNKPSRSSISISRKNITTNGLTTTKNRNMSENPNLEHENRNADAKHVRTGDKPPPSPTKPALPQADKPSPPHNPSQAATQFNNEEERLLELSEESSEEELVLRRRSKSQSTNKSQSTDSSDRASRKSDSPKQLRVGVTENAKRLLKSPVKALATLTSSRRLSDHKSGKQEESGVRRFLGPVGRRLETSLKSGTNSSVPPSPEKPEKASKSSSLIEPVTKALAPRKLSALSFKRAEDRPRKPKAEQEAVNRRASESATPVEEQVKKVNEKRLDRRVATSLEGFTGKKKSSSDVKEPRRFFSTLRRETKHAAKQEQSATRDSDEDTIPSDPTSSADDDDTRTATPMGSQASAIQTSAPQSSLPNVTRRSSSQESGRRAPAQDVLIAGGSSVQRVMRRVFGLSPPSPRANKNADKNKTEPRSPGIPSKGQQQEKSKQERQVRKPGESDKPEPPTETQSKVQLRRGGGSVEADRIQTGNPKNKQRSSSLFSAEGVNTWDSDLPSTGGDAPSGTLKSFARSKIVKRRRANDALDAEYDRGKPKKARQKVVPVSSLKGKNVFDALAERKR
ncbi:Ubiquitin carboxyl-terminal hydrolase 42 [Gracilariopsis chorda]|uniref:Ubiquitin carboxyl-terminal hydrolase n=1 Tax=Gracilariopsis chorda TaxID=448386 RepID=A0A2V3J107_9FLOR|nr:Ubiquitin carboxyl-terminal hydrolase 42 [Gracilariopsis chorda]|eukprot:PXF48005.1 Ubiquitin carboxyl-terminal hydrolase 42 [Gracilariopsis chorda]